MARDSGRFASRANEARRAPLLPHPPPADPPRLRASFSPLQTHRRRSCRSGRPTWRRPTPRRCVPRVSRDARRLDSPRERRTPTVAFVPDPTPPAAVGRRQRLAPPRLRPASQRERRRQGEPRDRGAPERHRQGTPRGHARHPEHRSIAVSKPNRREKTNRVFYFFERTRFSSGRPLLRDAHRCGVPARILNPLRSRR